MKIYFFGCLRGVDGRTEAGHYLYEGYRWAERNITTPFGKTPDGTLCTKLEYQHKALLHHKDGWTAIGFWDRTGDSRPGSNSNFIAEGIHSFDEMLELADKTYPELCKRIGKIELFEEKV